MLQIIFPDKYEEFPWGNIEEFLSHGWVFQFNEIIREWIGLRQISKHSSRILDVMRSFVGGDKKTNFLYSKKESFG